MWPFTKKQQTPYLKFNIRDDGAFFITAYWPIRKGKERDKIIENTALLSHGILRSVDSYFWPFVEGAVKEYGHRVNDYETANLIIKETQKLLQRSFQNPLLCPTNVFKRVNH